MGFSLLLCAEILYRKSEIWYTALIKQGGRETGREFYLQNQSGALSGG